MSLKLLIVLILEISQLKNIYLKREVNSKIKSFFFCTKTIFNQRGSESSLQSVNSSYKTHRGQLWFRHQHCFTITLLIFLNI